MNISARFARALTGPNNAGAVAQAAIRNANLAVNGAKFDPFIIKVATAKDFENIWSSQKGDTAIDFFQFQPPADKRFLPLGDLAITHRRAVDAEGAFLIGSDQAGVLAHPTGFTFILDDHGSRHSRMLNYWWPIAPAGYTALGLCFNSGSRTPPNPDNYWCVKTDHLRTAPVLNTFWSDRNTNWEENGSLRTPGLAADMRPITDQVLIIPTTVLSAQGGQQGNLLVARQCLLDIAPSYPHDPAYDPNAAQGSRTAESLIKIAVLPYTAVNDPGYESQAKKSPFYFAANLAGWDCYGSYSAPEGGSQSVTFATGTQKSVSEAFKESTSLTVDVNVGLLAEGFSAGISTSFTQTFEYSTSTTTGQSTHSSTTTTINFPKSDPLWLWQRFADIAVYRHDGALLSSAIYNMADHRLVVAPKTDAGKAANKSAVAAQ